MKQIDLCKFLNFIAQIKISEIKDNVVPSPTVTSPPVHFLLN